MIPADYSAALASLWQPILVGSIVLGLFGCALALVDAWAERRKGR